MLNRIFLIGNLGRDPEMSYTPSGKAVTKFSLAVSRTQRNRETGENQKETEWFNIVTWDQLAENCNNLLHKGYKVFIEGRIQSHKYTDKNGVERTVWDVIANDMRLLESKEATSARAAAAGGGHGDTDETGADDIPF